MMSPNRRWTSQGALMTHWGCGKCCQYAEIENMSPLPSTRLKTFPFIMNCIYSGYKRRTVLIQRFFWAIFKCSESLFNNNNKKRVNKMFCLF